MMRLTTPRTRLALTTLDMTAMAPAERSILPVSSCSSLVKTLMDPEKIDLATIAQHALLLISVENSVKQ